MKGTRDWVTITNKGHDDVQVLRSSVSVYESAGWTVKDDKKSSSASSRRQKKETN